MRITDIYIHNYRAFYGEHHIALDKDGKNLMVYGENGSGKSSIFTALQMFFKASVGKVEVEENIFVLPSSKNTALVKLNIKESPVSSKTTSFDLKITDREIISADKAIIADANKIKGFFDYRSLLKTHIEHKQQVDLFEILVSGILYHSINRFSNKEIGKEWEAIHNDTFNKMQTKRQQDATKIYLRDKFNPGLKELLQSIETDTNLFMKYFGNDVKIKLDFDKVEYHGRRMLSGHNIKLNIDFYKTYIPKHQFFLNEARLSALAISLYLSSIRVNPLSGSLKILVLDDLLIGLDMSNRLPLLEILKDHFIEVAIESQFQIVMTTYDRVWYELVRNYFGTQKWKYIEIYSKSLKDEDFEIPVIYNEKGYIEKAKHYLAEKDNKASAVYIRTEFERVVKNICDAKRLIVTYKKNQKEITSEDFWLAITTQTNLDSGLVKDIETHRGTVMNPFSHYDLEKPEFTKELDNTIKAIEKLVTTASLPSTDANHLKKIITIDQLNKKIEALNKTIESKDKTIAELNKLVK